MRRPRDIDSELRALDAKARQLRARKAAQLGELVIGCGADALPVESLAGALLAAVASTDAGEREGWHAAGEAFFRREPRSAAPRPAVARGDAAQADRAAAPARAAPQP